LEKEDLESVFRVIEERKDEITEFLSQLVRFETPNPPGGNTGEAQKWFAEKLERLGF